jgi:uncharacterized Ntn-hydrolase superfamily protein
MRFGTFSIVGHDPCSGELGVAVATAIPAVGMFVPYAQAGVGAIANQAEPHPHFGPEGLRLMRDGLSAPEVVRRLLALDPKRGHHRQLLVVTRTGDVAAWTDVLRLRIEGVQYASHCLGEGVGAAGNILVAPETPERMVEAYTSASGSLARKLLTALGAGEAAGGDRRGKESAALIVASERAPFGGIAVDLRVDSHPDPVAELKRLWQRYREVYDEQSG